MKPLPCPFCGSEAVACMVGDGEGRAHVVECIVMECYGVGRTFDTQAEAITAWNRRADRRTPTPEAGQTHPIERDAPYFTHVDDAQHAPESARCCFDAGWNAALSNRPAVEDGVREVLAELLRLYDWRQELAREEGAVAIPAEKLTAEDVALTRVQWRERRRNLEANLRKYGREKKAAWDRAREVLSRSSEVSPSRSREDAPSATIDGAQAAGTGDSGSSPDGRPNFDAPVLQLLREFRSWVSCSQSCQFREKCICGAEALLKEIDAALPSGYLRSTTTSGAEGEER